MKKALKRITLGRETVRHLTQPVLEHVAGGRINLTAQTACDCPTVGECGPNTLQPSATNTSCTSAATHC
jgi:hypothetical protein